jgi:cytochrome oxidase Cu insertion factor (SCO1/SenC/PrrC family)
MKQERLLKIMASFSALALLATGFWLFTRPAAILLPVYGKSPDFTLQSQDGALFDSSRLKGKVWVASFVFSTCKSSCPMLAAQMKRLYSAMPEGAVFGLVSISVDPERDTPQRLAQYAKDLGVQDKRWVFLTGKKSYIRDLIVGGFKVAAEPGEVMEDNDILHSSKLVLVDAHGRIRGYFDGVLSESADQIKDAAERLIEEAKQD